MTRTGMWACEDIKEEAVGELAGGAGARWRRSSSRMRGTYLSGAQAERRRELASPEMERSLAVESWICAEIPAGKSLCGARLGWAGLP